MYNQRVLVELFLFPLVVVGHKVVHRLDELFHSQTSHTAGQEFFKRHVLH